MPYMKFTWKPPNKPHIIEDFEWPWLKHTSTLQQPSHFCSFYHLLISRPNHCNYH